MNLIVSSARIDCSRIHDWSSFHEEFDRVFAFPEFYGRNMDAWIDCMSSLDAPEDHLTGIHCERGRVLTIELANVQGFKQRNPEQYAALETIIRNLTSTKAGKPRKVKSLSNTINNLFGKSLGEAEVASFLKALEKRGHISLDGENVTYHF
jgi:RNAse (barnase) inhibitor barstar